MSWQLVQYFFCNDADRQTIYITSLTELTILFFFFKSTDVLIIKTAPTQVTNIPHCAIFVFLILVKHFASPCSGELLYAGKEEEKTSPGQNFHIKPNLNDRLLCGSIVNYLDMLYAFQCVSVYTGRQRIQSRLSLSLYPSL